MWLVPLVGVIAAVAPHWGAWIEIGRGCAGCRRVPVAPHWGAWIEIAIRKVRHAIAKVAPHWGAWIEIHSA